MERDSKDLRMEPNNNPNPDAPIYSPIRDFDGNFVDPDIQAVNNYVNEEEPILPYNLWSFPMLPPQFSHIITTNTLPSSSNARINNSKYPKDNQLIQQNYIQPFPLEIQTGNNNQGESSNANLSESNKETILITKEMLEQRIEEKQNGRKIVLNELEIKEITSLQEKVEFVYQNINFNSQPKGIFNEFALNHSTIDGDFIQFLKKRIYKCHEYHYINKKNKNHYWRCKYRKQKVNENMKVFIRKGYSIGSKIPCNGRITCRKDYVIEENNKHNNCEQFGNISISKEICNCHTVIWEGKELTIRNFVGSQEIGVQCKLHTFEIENNMIEAKFIVVWSEPILIGKDDVVKEHHFEITNELELEKIK
ncbi:hypothetical protein Mgra_00004815 [Meloidogyne graminicola]|uniref:Uncharacterized protein n=1 Tax=Meloidogyne graminicola TaxID=189291 RepID=A0A8S9ZRA9_9BILA|nr:hypothetical protein Mgra_00004815 [Meloidogyne graminicola]